MWIGGDKEYIDIKRTGMCIEQYKIWSEWECGEFTIRIGFDEEEARIQEIERMEFDGERMRVMNYVCIDVYNNDMI